MVSAAWAGAVTPAKTINTSRLAETIRMASSHARLLSKRIMPNLRQSITTGLIPLNNITLDNHSKCRHASAMAFAQTLPDTIECRRDYAPVGFSDALAVMNARNSAINDSTARELIWLLEHPPVYTAGTSAHPDELLDPRFEVVTAGRGGRRKYRRRSLWIGRCASASRHSASAGHRRRW